MRAFPGARAGLLPGGGAGGGRERAARGGVAGCAPGPDRGADVGIRALILGGARSGKSAFAEELALSSGGGNVLYVATALASPEDPELSRRIESHRERRHSGWGLLEIGGGSLSPILEAAGGYTAVLFDSLTLWVSARMSHGDERGTLGEFECFAGRAGELDTPIILVSDEVGLGLVPESAEGRRFRDLLGLVNQRAATRADEVHLCVAGIARRIK